MPSTREDELTDRAQKILSWIVYLDEVYSGLLSRPAETASLPGFDPEPQTRPCEHRAPWRRGKLCLACDNSGWRPLTARERDEGAGTDPYSVDVPAVKPPEDDKELGRRRLDHILDGLERDARVRDGSEALEDRELRNYRLVANKSRSLVAIEKGLRRMRAEWPAVYEMLPAESALLVLARLTPGRIRRPPA